MVSTLQDNPDKHDDNNQTDCSADTYEGSKQDVDGAIGDIINLFGWFWDASICVACHLLLVIVIGAELRDGPMGLPLDITINIQTPVDPRVKAW